jgi:energy-coupling factor transport system substrate-specific component
MWKHTKMNVLVAITAAAYAGLMIPFKGIQFIPGFTELRPASVIPITFGILFGPAAAWGSAIGNIIGDFMGTLGPGSIPGAIGNFFFALVCYKLFPIDILKKAKINSTGFSLPVILKIEAVVILASGTVAFTIAWGLEIMRLLPYGFFAPVVFFNNVIISLVLVPIILFILYPRVEKWELVWTDIMEDDDIKQPKLSGIGKAMLTIGILGGLIVGVLVSLGYYDVHLFKFQAGGGSTGVILSVLPFIILFLIGCLLA